MIIIDVVQNGGIDFSSSSLTGKKIPFDIFTGCTGVLTMIIPFTVSFQVFHVRIFGSCRSFVTCWCSTAVGLVWRKYLSPYILHV